MEWLKDLKKEKLPEKYREMFEVIRETVGDDYTAMKCTLALARYYDKQPFYYSGLEDMVAREQREFVIKNRGRIDVCELSRVTGKSTRWIYDIYEELASRKQRDLFTDNAATAVRSEK